MIGLDRVHIEIMGIDPDRAAGEEREEAAFGLAGDDDPFGAQG